MNIFEKIKRKLKVLYRRYIRREPFLIEVARWFNDRGDETLRLDYPLTAESVVFDLGGYHGDFASAINERYGSSVYLFEPVSEFYKKCLARFHDNPKIICLNYGLSSENGWMDIGVAENASSFASPHATGVVQPVQVRSVVECIRELKINKIDLMKINIEGGEFEVIPAMIESGSIKMVSNLQIQFHNFVDQATLRRDDIRKKLAETHTEMWNYEFVWESWSLKRNDE